MLPVPSNVIGTSMDASPSLDDDVLALQQRILDRVRSDDRSVLEDLQFLTAWDKGLVPWLNASLRMRQIRRANPPVPSPSATAVGRSGPLLG